MGEHDFNKLQQSYQLSRKTQNREQLAGLLKAFKSFRGAVGPESSTTYEPSGHSCSGEKKYGNTPQINQSLLFVVL